MIPPMGPLSMRAVFRLAFDALAFELRRRFRRMRRR